MAKHRMLMALDSSQSKRLIPAATVCGQYCPDLSTLLLVESIVAYVKNTTAFPYMDIPAGTVVELPVELP